MITSSLTPKQAGPHRRYTRFGYSMALAILALIMVFALLVIMYFAMPPMG